MKLFLRVLTLYGLKSRNVIVQTINMQKRQTVTFVTYEN